MPKQHILTPGVGEILTVLAEEVRAGRRIVAIANYISPRDYAVIGYIVVTEDKEEERPTPKRDEREAYRPG